VCSDLINKKDFGMSLEELLILLVWNVNCIRDGLSSSGC